LHNLNTEDNEQASSLSKQNYAFLQQLSESPYNFDFFQTIRRLECTYGKQLGKTEHLADDPVRLAHENSIAFAPSTLFSFTPATIEKKARLSSYFLGLLGPQGPLPQYLNDYVSERKIHHRDHAFSEFLDIFHHRMLSFFYRAWADSEPVVNLDHKIRQDDFKNYTGSLFGIGDTAFQDRDAFNDHSKLFMAGHLACQTKHVQGLESIITAYFHCSVKIIEFIGDWIYLPEDNICQLGIDSDVNLLGQNTLIGTRIWETQQKFRIVFKSLSYDEYVKFLPGHPSLNILIAMVRHYIGDILDWDLQLILKKEDVPALALNGKQQLGYTSWAVINHKINDADEFIFSPLLING
jgi:type VI secretion system protein ImpH